MSKVFNHGCTCKSGEFKYICRFHLYKGSKILRLIEGRNVEVVTTDWEQEK